MNSRVFGRCWPVFVVALVFGCQSNESRCETLCEWVDDCTDTPANCSDNSIEDCADDVDDADDDCQDAFDGFVDCLDENDNDCDDIVRHCQGEAAEFVEQCNGEL